MPQVSLATDTDYEPPATYYSSSAGFTGSTLKTKLATIMTTGFVSRTYGDIRYAHATLDTDPNNPGKILLIYNRASVNSAWDAGVTYNREHQWPCSLLGMDTPSNSYKGVASDFHMLRPCNVSINSSRSNSPFGTVTSSGTYGYKTSGFFYPGNADAGDVARTMFYAATRWNGFNNLTLINGSPGTYKMGDLNSLLHWHYIDVPDAFERRRNQAVYSSTLNPSYYQGNRNAYVDHPEYVWSVYVDQANDSQITAGTPTVDLGRVLVGAPLETRAVTITKTGVDGTYYEIKTTGNATSSVTGRYNAFVMDSAGSKTITVGLNASTGTPGLKSGTVIVDNLDVTTGGGSGKGANDPDDCITVAAKVLDHARASFSGTQEVTSLTLDFGTIDQNSTPVSLSFSIHNLNRTPGYTAGLDVDSVAINGDSDRFSEWLRPFKNLPAGDSRQLTFTLDSTHIGTFTCDYTLMCSDEDISGTAMFSTLSLRVVGVVKAAPVTQVPGDANGDGIVDVGDLGILAAHYGTTADATWSMGDFNTDGVVDVGDLGILAANYGLGTVEGALDFNTDYARTFATGTQESELLDEDSLEQEAASSLCFAWGLPVIVGLMVGGLFFKPLG